VCVCVLLRLLCGHHGPIHTPYLCICIRVFSCVRVCRHSNIYICAHYRALTHANIHAQKHISTHACTYLCIQKRIYLLTITNKQKWKGTWCTKLCHMLQHTATHWQVQVMQRHTVHQLDKAQFAHACMVARELHLSCFPSSSCCPVQHTHKHLHTLACARADTRAHADCQSCQRSHRRSSVWNSTTKCHPTASLYIAAPCSPRTARSDRCVCVFVTSVYFFPHIVYFSSVAYALVHMRLCVQVYGFWMSLNCCAFRAIICYHLCHLCLHF